MLAPRSFVVRLDDQAVQADIGFHAFEVGRPQRLLVSIWVKVDPAFLPEDDRVAGAWDYDVLREMVTRLAAERHYDLQETLARRIFDAVAALDGVLAIQVSSRKPDVYADAKGVGITLSSFQTSGPSE